jgi:ribonuclease-3
LDKLSHKEVNFKSRLIEWGQKRKVVVDFKLIDQQKDESGNPIFKTEIMLENISAGQGEGYSKKESQQVAARAAFVKLHDSNFVELIDQAQEEREASVVEVLSETVVSESQSTDKLENNIDELSTLLDVDVKMEAKAEEN